MNTPTVTTAGLSNNLLLIIDHKKASHRIPKDSVGDIADSSVGKIFRLDICHRGGEIYLVFESRKELDGFLKSIDGLF